MSPERVSVGEEGQVIPCWGTENRKGAGTNSGRESGARNLEAESIREFGRVCKVEDVTEIRRSSARDRECLSCIEFFVGLEASGEIETEELCGQFYIFSVWGKQHSSVCDEGFAQRKQASQKGENCSSQGATAWVRWPVSSPSCSTRTIQKSLTFNEKYLRVFSFVEKCQENGPLAEKW